MRQFDCEVVWDGKDLYVELNGVKIAKRGRPGTPQAGTWVATEPGYAVEGDAEELIITIEKAPVLGGRAKPAF